MSKELQSNQQTLHGSEELSYPASHVMPKVQSKIQAKVYSKIQPKLMTDLSRGNEENTEPSLSEKLPELVQAKMENSFGQDFSKVKIHTDSSSAENINARAYTQGSDVHFAPGEYNPSSKSGQELIGHELTHVVQQGQGRVGSGEIHGKGIEINQEVGLEKEADEAGKLASEGKGVAVNGSATGVQLKPMDDVNEEEFMHYKWTTVYFDFQKIDTIVAQYWKPEDGVDVKEYVKKVIVRTNNFQKEDLNRELKGEYWIPLPVHQADVRNGQASEALANWQAASYIQIDRLNKWTDNNMSEYLRRTYVDPSLSGAIQMDLPGIMWEALGNGVAESFLKVAEKYGAGQIAEKISSKMSAKLAAGAFGAAIGSVVPIAGTAAGFAIGFVAGTLIEVLTGEIVDYFKGTDFEEGGKVAVDTYSAMVKSEILKSGAHANEAKTNIQEIEKTVRARIYLLSDQEALNTITASLNQEIALINSSLVNTADLSLMNRFLQDWLMQNAGHEEDAFRRDLMPQWDENIKYVNENVTGFANGGAKEELTDHPETWIYQLSKDFSRFGIKDTKFSSYAASSNVKTWIKEGKSSEFIIGQYTTKYWEVYPTDIANPEQFIAYVNKTCNTSSLTAQGIEKIKAKKDFKFTFDVDLKKAGDLNSTIFVDRFNYKIEFQNWDQALGGFSSYHWTESADLSIPGY